MNFEFLKDINELVYSLIRDAEKNTMINPENAGNEVRRSLEAFTNQIAGDYRIDMKAYGASHGREVTLEDVINAIKDKGVSKFDHDTAHDIRKRTNRYSHVRKVGKRSSLKHKQEAYETVMEALEKFHTLTSRYYGKDVGRFRTLLPIGRYIPVERYPSKNPADNYECLYRYVAEYEAGGANETAMVAVFRKEGNSSRYLRECSERYRKANESKWGGSFSAENVTDPDKSDPSPFYIVAYRKEKVRIEVRQVYADRTGGNSGNKASSSSQSSYDEGAAGCGCLLFIIIAVVAFFAGRGAVSGSRNETQARTVAETVPLTELTEEDIFSAVSVSFEGVSGQATAQLSLDWKNEYYRYIRDMDFEVLPDDGLHYGDEVEVICTPGDLSGYGYEAQAKMERVYTVEGIPHYIERPEDITEEVLGILLGKTDTAALEYYEAMLQKKFSYYNPNGLHVNPYLPVIEKAAVPSFIGIKAKSSTAYTSFLFFIYRCSYMVDGGETEYYFTVVAKDALVDENGDLVEAERISVETEENLHESYSELCSGKISHYGINNITYSDAYILYDLGLPEE